MSYENILVSTEGHIGLIQLNRPQKMNALNRPLMSELAQALREFDADDKIRCVVLHGNERAFAAGADIDEMAHAGAIEMYLRAQFDTWDAVRRFRKPLLAGVSGFALGGGCELTLMCDMIVASETARFGQPEINIGVIPGAGGTQRLPRAVGKALAMEMVLTGRHITAEEARVAGMVNRVVPVEVYLEEAKRLAREVAGKSPVATRLGKASVLYAFDSNLQTGLEMERQNFYLLFASEDQKEGMEAFLKKRKPEWKGR